MSWRSHPPKSGFVRASLAELSPSSGPKDPTTTPKVSMSSNQPIPNAPFHPPSHHGWKHHLSKTSSNGSAAGALGDSEALLSPVTLPLKESKASDTFLLVAARSAVTHRRNHLPLSRTQGSQLRVARPWLKEARPQRNLTLYSKPTPLILEPSTEIHQLGSNPKLPPLQTLTGSPALFGAPLPQERPIALNKLTGPVSIHALLRASILAGSNSCMPPHTLGSCAVFDSNSFFLICSFVLSFLRSFFFLSFLLSSVVLSFSFLPSACLYVHPSS